LGIDGVVLAATVLIGAQAEVVLFVHARGKDPRTIANDLVTEFDAVDCRDARSGCRRRIAPFEVID
jgi:hypothetical protein